MKTFARKLLSAVNILTIIVIVSLILFSVDSIRTNYLHLIYISSKIGQEYNNSFNKYKKTITFILKNNLPANMDYFNLTGNTLYDLPPVKEFHLFESKNANTSNMSAPNNGDTDIITVCHTNRCVKIRIDKNTVTNKVQKNEMGKYSELLTIPFEKTSLLKTSIRLFFKAHTDPLLIILTYLFLLYSSQSLLLLRKNRNLTNDNANLTTSLNLVHQESSKQILKCNTLYDNVLFTVDLINDYFTYCINQVLARNVYIEELQLADIFNQIKKFFLYQIIKKDLKIILDCEDAKTIVTDNEFFFLVLLNLIYKAIDRSKLSSDITIKVAQTPETVNIEINDIGYERNIKLTDKIRIYDLPEPILKKLCQKVKIRVINARKDMANFINIEVTNIASNKTEGIGSNSNEAIKIKLVPLC